MGNRTRYLLVCALVGLAVSWMPTLVHGPIPEKFNVLYIRGATMVWAWYVARGLIGFMVGVTHWPRPWWIRGPMFGALTMLPLGITSVATPGCGWP